jgi:hypothetical protein
MLRHILLWSVLFLAVTAAGCSRIEFFYNRADWLLAQYVESLVTLDERQSDQLEQQIDRLMDWHCAAQLPGYARLLRDAEADLVTGRMDDAQVRRYLARIQVFWQEFADAVTPPLSELLASANDDQIAELLASLAEGNVEARERYIGDSPEDVREQYRERMTDQLERWIGDLNPAQDSLVTRWSETFEPLGEEGMAQRRAWQARFAQLLQARNDPEQLSSGLRALLADPGSVRSASYAAKLDRNRERAFSLLVAVAGALDAEQRSYLREQVRHYSGAFERLSCDGDDLPAVAAL